MDYDSLDTKRMKKGGSWGQKEVELSHQDEERSGNGKGHGRDPLVDDHPGRRSPESKQKTDQSEAKA